MQVKILSVLARNAVTATPEIQNMRSRQRAGGASPGLTSPTPNSDGWRFRRNSSSDGTESESSTDRSLPVELRCNPYPFPCTGPPILARRIPSREAHLIIKDMLSQAHSSLRLFGRPIMPGGPRPCPLSLPRGWPRRVRSHICPCDRLPVRSPRLHFRCNLAASGPRLLLKARSALIRLADLPFPRPRTGHNAALNFGGPVHRSWLASMAGS